MNVQNFMQIRQPRQKSLHFLPVTVAQTHLLSSPNGEIFLLKESLQTFYHFHFVDGENVFVL